MLHYALSRLLPKNFLVDNFVFRLNYRWTVLLLITCSVIVTCKLWLGHSFACTQVKDVPLGLLETKCYAEAVYSSPVQLFQNPGRSLSPTTKNPPVIGYRRYQSFYSWVNLLFLLQAFIFFLPHLMWKAFDSSRLARLTSGLELYGNKERKRGSELCFLAKYILTTQGKHKLYTSFYIFCETCNYSISLGQTLYLVHFFMVTGVPNFLPFYITTWSDFEKFYFPPLGECTFSLDNIHHHHSMCILPLNRLYMYMFLFIHAWYICLTILSGLVLVYRIVLLVPSARVTFMRLSAPWSDKETLKSLCHRLSYSDWFFLTRFQRIMTDIDFAQMLDKISSVSECNVCDLQKDEDNTSLSSDFGHKEFSSTATSPV